MVVLYIVVFAILFESLFIFFLMLIALLLFQRIVIFNHHRRSGKSFLINTFETESYYYLHEINIFMGRIIKDIKYINFIY